MLTGASTPPATVTRAIAMHMTAAELAARLLPADAPASIVAVKLNDLGTTSPWPSLLSVTFYERAEALERSICARNIINVDLVAANAAEDVSQFDVETRVTALHYSKAFAVLDDAAPPSRERCESRPAAKYARGEGEPEAKLAILRLMLQARGRARGAEPLGFAIECRDFSGRHSGTACGDARQAFAELSFDRLAVLSSDYRTWMPVQRANSPDFDRKEIMVKPTLLIGTPDSAIVY